MAPIKGYLFECRPCKLQFCQNCALDDTAHDPTHDLNLRKRPANSFKKPHEAFLEKPILQNHNLLIKVLGDELETIFVHGAGKQILKTWTVQNVGNLDWPPGSVFIVHRDPKSPW